MGKVVPSSTAITPAKMATAMAAYRNRGGKAAAAVLVNAGVPLEQAATAIADAADNARKRRQGPTVPTLRWNELLRLIAGRHGCAVDTDDGDAYLPVLVSATSARQRQEYPDEVLRRIMAVLPHVASDAIRAAIEDGNKLTAQEAGDAVALTVTERERYGIATMRPARMNARAFATYTGKRKLALQSVRRAAAKPPRLRFRVSELAAQLGINRKTVQRAVADPTGRALWRLIDRHLDKCPKKEATNYIFARFKTATFSADGGIARAVEAQRSPFRYVDPVAYRAVIRPLLAALPRIIAELERHADGIGADASLGEVIDAIEDRAVGRVGADPSGPG